MKMGTRTIFAAVIAVAVVVVATLVVPWPRGLAEPASGDAGVIQSVGPYLDNGVRKKVAVAYLDANGSVRYAGWGADEHTVFEIGSITKTFTAQLLADSISRGEITLDTTLGEVFSELDGADAARVTMEELATHTSGMPRILGTSVWRTFLHLDPYTQDLDALLKVVVRQKLTPGEYEYSNTGVTLLGAAVAKRAGTDYPTLVRERLLEPLGMNETTVPTRVEDLPQGYATGFTEVGVPAAAWTMGAHAPAGAIRSTAHDLALWVSAVSTGKAPGMDSGDTGPGADPRAGRVDLGNGLKVGLTWMTEERDGTTVTWHNGGTGGFSSYAGFVSGGSGSAGDAVGTGIVVVSNTATSVDSAMDYLFDQAGASSPAASKR